LSIKIFEPWTRFVYILALITGKTHKDSASLNGEERLRSRAEALKIDSEQSEWDDRTRENTFRGVGGPT